MALMLGAMVVMGITPGPKVMTDSPELFWGLIASMWIGNLMLIVLNLPFVGIWVKLLTVPYRFLFPSIVCFCVIGLYTLSNNNFDIYLAGLFAVIGFAFIKLRCEAGPLLLGMVLGPMLEENLRRTLLVARGDWSVLFTRPISGTLIALAVVMLLAAMLPSISQRRNRAFKD
jgi:TctA family transporter